MDITSLLSSSPCDGVSIANLLCSPSDQHQHANDQAQIQDAENQSQHVNDIVPRPAPPDARPAKRVKRSKKGSAASSSTALSVVPDKDRKRPNRVSTKQRERRRDNQALESRKYNLMLDINNLKQEVRRLQECRDLFLTRLTVSRQHAQGEAVRTVARLFRLFCAETCGVDELEPDDRSLFLSRVHSCLTDPSAGGRNDIPHFMQTWRNFKILFTHRSYTVKSIRSLIYVGACDHDDEEDTDTSAGSEAQMLVAEARKRCGPGGGCVVESLGEYAGRLKRDTITALFPWLLQDEELVLRLIGQRFTCPLRQLAYFNSDGLMVDHTADFDLFGALNTLIAATQH